MKFKDVFEKMEMTKTELAYRTGVTEQTVNLWINKNQVPHSRQLQKIDELLASKGLQFNLLKIFKE